MDNPKAVSRSAIHFLTGTFFSRLSGLGRDMAMAFCFGVNPAIAAFMVAFRFANLMRRLFGEGSLSSSFIPYFESIRASDAQKGFQFFRDFLASMSSLLIVCILLVEGALFMWLKKGGLSPDAAQILYLTMLMLPGVLFICLFAISSALLQCEKKFFLTGVSPAAFNVIWIVAAIGLKDRGPDNAVIPLSIAIVLGFFAQWLMTVPGAFSFTRNSLSLRNCFRVELFSQEFRAVLKPLLLSVIGVGAVQINSALDGVFARFASLEGPAYLWYAIRLEQLPLALFGIALSSALLPPLSRAVKAQDPAQFQLLVNFAIRRAFSLIFPCVIGMLVFGAAGVNLIFGRGDFNDLAATNTIICLWAYAAGLLPTVFVLILAPALYARKDYRTPTILSVCAVVLNIALNALMVFGLNWGAFSIAIATSLCALFNCWMLVHYLSKKIGPILEPTILFSFGKTIVSSLVAGTLAVFLSRLFIGDLTIEVMLGKAVTFSHRFLEQLVQFCVPFFLFLLFFFAIAYLLKAQDVIELFKTKRSKLDVIE
ncbi:MAG TPA: murein biosynthesis integral membrane protein MurJ [Rhabdochlamydiaceae bacterium]|nr:murein biosynthesis integral membrane protein MurJ [Rhabdochlamydiaceae bacterium]